jgi:hypothetical protein
MAMKSGPLEMTGSTPTLTVVVSAGAAAGAVAAGAWVFAAGACVGAV